MVIIKSIGLGLLALVVGNLLALVLSLITGAIPDLIATKFLPEPILKKIRHIWSYAWIGFTVGMINSASIHFFKINGWILLIIFIFYLVFFMKHKNNYVYETLCAGDEIQFNRLSRLTETITFISYLVGSYGLWTILMKWS